MPPRAKRSCTTPLFWSHPSSTCHYLAHVRLYSPMFNTSCLFDILLQHVRRRENDRMLPNLPAAVPLLIAQCILTVVERHLLHARWIHCTWKKHMELRNVIHSSFDLDRPSVWSVSKSRSSFDHPMIDCRAVCSSVHALPLTVAVMRIVSCLHQCLLPCLVRYPWNSNMSVHSPATITR